MQDFKKSLIKLVGYLKTEKNQQIVAELKPKLPGLEDELRKMKAEVDEMKAKQSHHQTQAQKSQAPQNKTKY